MKILTQRCTVNGLAYVIRSAIKEDAAQMSILRLQIDGESENLDREKGEGFIDKAGFEKIIRKDADQRRNLFLVAETDGELVGYARCEGSELKRLLHKVEFGVAVRKDFWGYGIGRNLLQQSLDWADSEKISKVILSVLETNQKAIRLYEKLGFVKEGLLKRDKFLSDGNYYDTILMGRHREWKCRDFPAKTKENLLSLECRS
ncbi:GNAT family N-acetyltransferase [Bacillus salacetis]|uniref:GNAT family N-acetyltransferase n=1 Tax=Bacillus salacetis TaxID=2315464 RepID=A0A3A1R448_9BACI|nr:GNAT family N-acetyltransferase [Bacillus salacetis]RIW37339.1 GNAT family N-acetyltransferase [Bacillus salacetis]